MSILGESQEMLGQLISRYLTDNFDFETRQKALAEHGWPAVLWAAFAQELGILSVPFPEATGGLGLGPLDTMVVMEALGCGLAAEPYLSSVVSFGAIVRGLGADKAGDIAALIAGVIDGTVRVAIAIADDEGQPGTGGRVVKQNGDGLVVQGSAAFVPGAIGATHILLSAAAADGTPTLLLVTRDVAGLDWEDMPTIDGHGAAALKIDATVPATSVIATDASALVDAAYDAMLAALAAEIVGIIAALLDITVDFAKQRTQFGKPIAQFQVIQHRLADMRVESELARSMALLAALKQGTSATERRAVSAAAKARAGKAGRFVSQNAVQIHGGIGTTDELVVGHYFKRLLAIEMLFGGAHGHIERYVDHRAELGHPVPVV